MASSFALLLLFAVVCGAAALAARLVHRRLGGPEVVGFFLLVVVLLFPGFFRGRTILPVDHAMLLAPWSHVGTATRYNANLNDAATQIAPWSKAVRMAWKEGSLPLRDRWNGSGMSLAANGQSAAFSPFTFLMFPLPLAAAFTLLIAAKIFLALAGMSLWLRELSLSRAAAAFGAVLFALSFSMGPWLFFPHASVLALAPWALFAIERLRDRAAGSRAFVLLTAVFVAWPLCGHPESVVISSLFAALWLAVRFAVGDLPDAPRLAGRIGLAAAIALGLSAFLTVPEAIAIGASNRIRFAEDFRRGLPSSLAPHLPYMPGGFMTFLFPRSFGDAIDSPMIPGASASFPEMALGWFGVVGAAIALLVLRRGGHRPRAEVALLAPFLLGLLAATGSWPVFELLIRTPGLRLMIVLRYFSWLVFAGAAIAAFEADRLARDLSRDRRAAAGAVLSTAALACVAVWAYRHLAPLHAAAGGLGSQKRALVATLAALGVTAAIALACAARPTLSRSLPILLAAAAAVELSVQGARIFRFGPPEQLFPETPLIRFLRSRPAPFRIAGDGAVLFPNTNVFAGLDDIRTHDPVERRDYVDFLNRNAGYPPADYFKRISDWNAPALDLLNLKYLAAEPGQASPGEKWRRVYDGPDGVVFENAHALPRVFGESRIRAETRSAPDGFALSEYQETTNRIAFRARVPPGRAARAVASVVQDGGWSAMDEAGRELPAARAEGILLALELPPGDHRIRMRYCPPGFVAGSTVSLATACSLGLAGLVTAGRRRRPRRCPGSGSG